MPERLAGSPAGPGGAFLRRAAALLAAALLSACAGQLDPVRDGLAEVAVRQNLKADDVSPGLKAFYRERGRPLWIEGGRLRPEAALVLKMVSDPRARAALERQVARAGEGDPLRLAEAELALSEAVAAYAAETYRPGPFAIVYADRRRAPPGSDLEAMRVVARGDAVSANLRALLRVNPIYAELAAAERSHADADAAPILRANLTRLRGLPPELGDRYVLVDVPAARLWLYEGGVPVDSMRAVVGRPKHPTPLMAATLRFAVFNPYWNVPPDLVRDDIAPQVLRAGPGVLARRDMEVLTDWSPAARVVDPATVDWAAVAAGRQVVRLRQRPGPDNMMGGVKLEMPNRLGIYLHDTPDRSAFAQAARLRSAGCVRLEDAARLSRWLFEGREPARSGVEQRVALPRPVPIYIVYRTAVLENGRLARRSDVYGLDARWTQSTRLAER